ncbi:hypothetical protein K4F52_006560 [Lecanicillium sp. MT-2017a]|nr:hypothetical protein K4F52_006560 [Lecanicillium sp. MT-2017a]
MERKYIPNNMPLQSLACSPKEMLESTLSELVCTYPPIEKYPDEKQKGIFSGYTSLIYLLFRISALHPDLKADGRDLRFWIEDYMSHLPHDIGFKTGYGGIHSEKLSVEAIRACMTGAEDDLNKFLQHIGEYLGPYPGDDPYPAELFYGRAGVLYILRMVRHYIPKHSDVIQPYIEKVAMNIMEEEKAEKVTWEYGLLRKEPSICHGIFGNALSLLLGPKRYHFLSHATPESVAKAKQNDSNIFQKASYTADLSPYLTYLASAAWTWAVCEMEEASIIAFNDL